MPGGSAALHLVEEGDLWCTESLVETQNRCVEDIRIRYIGHELLGQRFPSPQGTKIRRTKPPTFYPRQALLKKGGMFGLLFDCIMQLVSQ
ncbi:hypothetical protein IscW_ISCW003798 [Ixodes scapularis]|uniref:Uncharacterized protein n=1 Tax=Ixodes scapularis TaxID=6945 RepID=B7PEB9_IXOSC|nr:hypothetical protein IscW_ISCW003798 [Ixodes scapularis]|eukprot:XP_002400807.1 hypothetical protein IscW_ISCW003798 [Ixodes scapularis]